MSGGEAVSGILAGTKVEVCSVERTADGGILLGLITDPPTWVTTNDPQVDAIEEAWRAGGRIVIPMPPAEALMYEATSSTTFNSRENQECPCGLRAEARSLDQEN